MSLYKISGYKSVYKQRASRSGGGLCVYAKENYFEHLEIKICRGVITNPVFLCAISHPPNCKLKSFLNDFDNYIDFISSIHPYSSRLIFARDFSINLLHVDTNHLVSQFVDIMHNNSLFPAIHEPTRITTKSATLIDDIFY